MIIKYIISLIVVFFLNCNIQIASKENEEVINAKWYFYSYSIELNAYDKNGKEILPLTFDIKLLRILKINNDTTKFFFIAYHNDTLNTCLFKPLDLIGIIKVKNKIYLPIYHTVVFDKENDSTVFERMNKQSELMQSKVLKDKRTNLWLQTEVKKRSEFKND